MSSAVAHVLAGVALEDVTPPLGLPMAGFAARTGGADRTHDALTVRAIAVGETAIVVADVIGLDEASCARVRRRAPMPADRVIVAATHTHGGPATMPGRLTQPVDAAYLAGLEDACVLALERAFAMREPCTLRFGIGADPGVAKNRRRDDGPVDRGVPVLVVHRSDGQPLAHLVVHACHPVVLGPDNTAWTGDYPFFVRCGIEAARPGTLCLFLTGCCGDVNTGHAASASFSTAPAPRRTFAEALRIGAVIADAALAAETILVQGSVDAAHVDLLLDLDASAAATFGPHEPWPARVTVLDWGGIRLVGLPGEPFAWIGIELRLRLAGPTIAIAYANGCPGYFPTEDEYKQGGYEVLEAHRYYGMPAPFAPGSAERLLDAAVTASARLR